MFGDYMLHNIIILCWSKEPIKIKDYGQNTIDCTTNCPMHQKPDISVLFFHKKKNRPPPKNK